VGEKVKGGFAGGYLREGEKKYSVPSSVAVEDWRGMFSLYVKKPEKKKKKKKKRNQIQT